MNSTPAPHSEGSVFTAPNVDQATQAGLRTLGVDPEEVEVRVLDRGWRGFLGFGARAAKVALVPRLSFGPLVEDLARGILTRMEIEAVVRASQVGLDVQVEVECPGADGLLIGRKGETLAAFEHILHRMSARKTAGKVRDVRVDVAGYRDRREEQLRLDALALAEKVRRSGRRAMTEPLLPGERRIVHRALEGVSGVRTHVSGTGSNRRVVVMPAGDSGSRGPARRS